MAAARVAEARADAAAKSSRTAAGTVREIQAAKAEAAELAAQVLVADAALSYTSGSGACAAR